MRVIHDRHSRIRFSIKSLELRVLAAMKISSPPLIASFFLNIYEILNIVHNASE